MAVIGLRPPIVISGGILINLPIAAAQTFVIGQIAKVVANAVTAWAAAADAQLVIVMQNCTGLATGTKIRCLKITADTFLEMNITNTALAASQIGISYGIITSSGVNVIDVATGALNTANARMKIVEIDIGQSGDPTLIYGTLTDTFARVRAVPVLDSSTGTTGVNTAISAWF
jgi:hypothetical protein